MAGLKTEPFAWLEGTAGPLPQHRLFSSTYSSNRGRELRWETALIHTEVLREAPLDILIKNSVLQCKIYRIYVR